MKSTIIFCLIFCLVSLPLKIQAQIVAPQVTNVVATQIQNSTSVRITYDLADGDTDLLFVMVEASEDSGKKFNVPVLHVTGDVGYGVAPGTGKQIIWDAFQDYPEMTVRYFQTKVVAADVPVGKMVLVPRDTFQMGTNQSLEEFGPAHTVIISSFYLSATEITNIQYKQFCDATNRSYPGDPVAGYFLNYPEYPAVNLTWEDAQAYCNWLSTLNGLEPCYNPATGAIDTSKTGYRLPTEAEWELAARGDVAGKTYPWGSDDITQTSCNYLAYSGDLSPEMPNFENNRGPLPVASFIETGRGFYDLAGNVAEWCLDRYDAEYYNSSPPVNPMGPTTGSTRNLRGGDWSRSLEYLRVFHRDKKDPASLVNGFYRGFRILQRAR